MNIKVKAGLTVLAFFVALIVILTTILSIPRAWVETIFKVAIVGVTLLFSYKVAYDYYVAKKELEEIEKKNKTAPKLNKELEIVDSDVWSFDDGASIRPSKGRRIQKKEEDSKS